jgi:hypothetical protein
VPTATALLKKVHGRTPEKTNTANGMGVSNRANWLRTNAKTDAWMSGRPIAQMIPSEARR